MQQLLIVPIFLQQSQQNAETYETEDLENNSVSANDNDTIKSK